MTQVPFYKFDGAGNDFVLIDAREEMPPLDEERICRICHRRFGVGADGLMLLMKGENGYDFRMRYFNSDGHPADMCGNGGRCIAMFAFMLGIVTHCPDDQGVGEASLCFVADDGPHAAALLSWDEKKQVGTVRLSMRDVAADTIVKVLDGMLLNTGVPHYVQEVEDLEHFDVVGEGRRIRHDPALGAAGANVNFVQAMPDGTLQVRTYERGVEDETWACGTGVTASAIATGRHRVITRGGNFVVSYNQRGGVYADITLTGPVSLNFTGTLPL